ncbi:NADPH-dependent curcumin reductase CurA [Bradyrhizobium sp. USDA 4503]
MGESIFKARSVAVKNLLVSDFVVDYHNEMLAHVAPLLAAGKIKYRGDIRRGFETIPTAFVEMLRGSQSRQDAVLSAR